MMKSDESKRSKYGKGSFSRPQNLDKEVRWFSCLTMRKC